MTHVADIVARDEKHAIELANDEIVELPEFARSITAYEHDLKGIANALEKKGFAVYYDDYRNNLHDFLRIDFVEHDDLDSYAYQLVCNLDIDLETYNGTGYTLTKNGEAIFLEAHRPAYLVADTIADALEARRPALKASVDDIAHLLTIMGTPSTVVDFGRYEGQPKVVHIGEIQVTDIHGLTATVPRFCLYPDFHSNMEISGMGWHLSWQDDEAVTVNDNIGNLTALEIVGQILYDMGRADFDNETQEGRNA
jgi:hypothetical protein